MPFPKTHGQIDEYLEVERHFHAESSHLA